MLRKLLSIKFHELVMHGHVGLLTDINGSVTDKFPIKDPVLSIMLHTTLLLSFFTQKRGLYCFPGFCFSRGKYSIASNYYILCFWSP